LTKSGVSVSDGRFSVSLDFGSSAFVGDQRWLASNVRCPDSGDYTALSPRQELTPTPYAIYSSGNWGFTGNASTTAGTNFVGTTDAVDFVIKTNNSEALRVASGGSVGIGATSPASALHIQSSTAAALQLDPFGTSAGNTGEQRFLELVANGTNYVGFKAPDSIAANEVWTLPSADGASGQLLRTDGSNVLTWVTPGGFSTSTLASTATLTATTEYHTDTSGSAFAVTLPSAPADGAEIRVMDVKATFNTKNLTVNRGGSDTIEGATSLVLSAQNGYYSFHHDAETDRWTVKEQGFPAPVTLHRARLERAAAQSIGNATNTKVLLDTSTYDVGSIGDPTTNNRITISQAGLYLINGGVCFTTAANVQAQLVVGGTIVQRQYLTESGGNGSWCANATTVRNLSASDQVTLQVYQGSGGSNNTLTGAEDRPFLEVVQLPTSAMADVGISDIADADNDTKIQTEESSDEDKIRFDTGGTERAIIDDSGQVGIGTSSPADPLHVSTDDATTNAVVDVLRVEHTTTGTAASGLGAGQVFYVEDAGGTEEQGSIDVILDDVTNSSEDATMTFSINQNGTITEIMRVDGTDGRVGIGSTAPTGLLQISGGPTSSVPNLRITDTNSSGNYGIIQIDSSQASNGNNWGFIDLRSSGGDREFLLNGAGDLLMDGSISAGSTTISAGSADVAEEFNVLDDAQPGDIVSIVSGIDVKKSSEAYSTSVMGIIATKPGINLSLRDEDGRPEVSNPLPVALVGRVPVNVTNENGPIRIGDFITASSTMGYGMKSTMSGRVVGMAVENFDAEIGQVMVQVINTWWPGPVSTGTPSGQRLQIEQLEAQNNLLKTELCARDGSYSWCQD